MEIRDIKMLIEKNIDFMIDENLVEKEKREHDIIEGMIKCVLSEENIENSMNKIKGMPTRRKIEEKYIVEGLEDLSIAVANLLSSGYGGYIVSYAHKFGVNHYVSGFKTEAELKKYASWTIEYFNRQYDTIEEEIKEMKKIETNLTKEELINKYKAQLKAKIKIYENIFDFKGKKKYCEEAESLRTIHSIIVSLSGVHSYIQPIYDQLMRQVYPSN